MKAEHVLTDALSAHDGLYQVSDGRLDDLTTQGGAIVTVLGAAARDLNCKGVGVVTYRLSEGPRLLADHLGKDLKDALVAAVQRHNLHGKQDLATTMRGLTGLLREPLPVVVVVLDAANCFPAVDRAFLDEAQLGLRELVAGLGRALWLQKNQNKIVLVAESGSLDSAIETAATRIRLTPPDKADKAAFLALLGPRYPRALFADGVSPADAARLMSGTTNRATERLMRQAHNRQEPITAQDLNHEKREALLEQTNGVLRLLDTSCLSEPVGDYMQPTLGLLAGFFAALLRADKHASPMLVFHGPPGTGKTFAAKWAAARANVLVLELQSQRASLVGEAEHRSRTLHEKRIDPAFTPNALLTDELAHIPTTRDGNDGGVTAALFGDWLSALSDPRYPSKSLVIATTNVPESLPAALQSRCEFWPVFSPSIADLAVILAHQCANIDLNNGDECCLAAAQIVAAKGGSPRDLDRMVRRVAREHPEPTWDDITAAAENVLVPASQWQAALYCDYHSLLTMSDKTCIPWSSQSEMPAHLAAVIDTNGGIDYDRVRTRLQDLGHVNV